MVYTSVGVKGYFSHHRNTITNQPFFLPPLCGRALTVLTDVWDMTGLVGPTCLNLARTQAKPPHPRRCDVPVRLATHTKTKFTHTKQPLTDMWADRGAPLVDPTGQPDVGSAGFDLQMLGAPTDTRARTPAKNTGRRKHFQTWHGTCTDSSPMRCTKNSLTCGPR